MALQLARHNRIVVLMVPTWPESGFRKGAAWLRGRGSAGRARTATGELRMGGDVGRRCPGLTESRREKTE